MLQFLEHQRICNALLGLKHRCLTTTARGWNSSRLICSCNKVFCSSQSFSTGIPAVRLSNLKHRHAYKRKNKPKLRTETVCIGIRVHSNEALLVDIKHTNTASTMMAQTDFTARRRAKQQHIIAIGLGANLQLWLMMALLQPHGKIQLLSCLSIVRRLSSAVYMHTKHACIH